MTKAAAIHEFFSGFGMSAYSTSSVPENAKFPYLTYELSTGAFDSGEVGIVANMWFYTESEAIPNSKVDELSEAIGMGGVMIPCDDGVIWIKRGSPWAQSLSDPTSANVKRRYINITLEYITLN